MGLGNGVNAVRAMVDLRVRPDQASDGDSDDDSDDGADVPERFPASRANLVDRESDLSSATASRRGGFTT